MYQVLYCVTKHPTKVMKYMHCIALLGLYVHVCNEMNIVTEDVYG